MDPLDLSDVRMVITSRDMERAERFRYSVYAKEQGKRARLSILDEPRARRSRVSPGGSAD